MSEDGAVITGAALSAGHDGTAELVLGLRHPGGTESQVVLDEDLGLALMARCGVSHVDELTGHSWRRIVESGNGI